MGCFGEFIYDCEILRTVTSQNRPECSIKQAGFRIGHKDGIRSLFGFHLGAVEKKTKDGIRRWKDGIRQISDGIRSRWNPQDGIRKSSDSIFGFHLSSDSIFFVSLLNHQLRDILESGGLTDFLKLCWL